MTWLKLTQERVEDGLPSVPDNSVDCIVTSPPYFEDDGWSVTLMKRLGRLFERVLKPGARAFVNFGATKEGEFHRPFLSASLIGKTEGLSSWQTIVWVKSIHVKGKTSGHVQAINSSHILAYCHEYIFQFVKKPVPGRPLNKLAIGVPFADKSNLTRGNRGINGDLRDGGDAWFLPYETTGKTKKKAHHHGYPLALPIRCLKLANIPKGGIVLDPFVGGGSTAIAAYRLGLNVYANDVSEEAIKTTRSLFRHERK